MRHVQLLLGTSVVSLAALMGAACGKSPAAPTATPTPASTVPAAAKPSTVQFVTLAYVQPLRAGSPVTIKLEVRDLSANLSAADHVAIDFGDGSQLNLGVTTSADLNHVYAAAGAYTLAAIATAGTSTAKTTIVVYVS